jgi:hypothetical protein
VTSRGFVPLDATSKNPNVFKMGRITGPTAGVANGCRAELRVYKSGTLRIASTELVLLPKSRIMAVQPFAGEGDSGALVYDGTAKAHSMVWGRPSLTHPAGQAFFSFNGIVFATPVQAALRGIDKTLAQLYLSEQVKTHLL